MSNSTPLKLCIQIFHETKIRGLNGSISTLFDERMNLNRRHKTQNCAMQGVSHLGERRTMLHDGVERFLFPFIRPSRYSRRAPPRRRIDEKKEKKEERSSRLGGNRKLPCYFSSNTVEGGRRVKRTRNRDAN